MKVIKRKNTVTKHAYEKFLEKNGWRFVGCGMYASVFVKGEVAIKVGSVESNTAYLSYIDRASKIKSSWVPKLGEMVYSTPKEEFADEYFALVMERLKPIGYGNKVVKQVSVLEEAANAYTKQEKRLYMKIAETAFKKQPGVVQVLQAINDLSRASGNYDTRRDYSYNDDSRDGFYVDIHEANVMMRASTKELVITDPLC